MHQFTDAKYMPAAEKRRVLRHWAPFLRTLADRYAEKDRCFAAFTEPLYTHLIQHLCRLAELPRFCSGKMSTTWKEEGGFSSK